MGTSSRYETLTRLASGGMATVYVGRVRGPLGFSRLVAIKRAHPHLLEDQVFTQMLVEEANVASRIHHPNVVAVLDVEREKGQGREPELRLVMEYVEGASLSELMAAATELGQKVPPAVAVRVVLDACAGLQVAHELCDASGERLGIVHRDVSPHNLLVGVDGLTRVADFGIVKATERPSSTTTGSLKGKLAYMAPEYVSEGRLDARADVFALGIVAWEALAGQKLFKGQNELDTLQRVALAEIPAVSSVAPELGKALDDVIAAALVRDPDERFSSARAFAAALEAEARAAGLKGEHVEVAKWVTRLVGVKLEQRRAEIRKRAQELDLIATNASAEGGALAEAVAAAKRIVDGSPATLPVAASLAEVADSSSQPASQALTSSGGTPEGAIGGGTSTTTTSARGLISGRATPKNKSWLWGVGAVLAAAVVLGVVVSRTAEPTPNGVAAAQSDLGSRSAPESPGASATPAPTATASAQALVEVEPVPSVSATVAPRQAGALVAKPNASVKPTATTDALTTVAPNPYGP